MQVEEIQSDMVDNMSNKLEKEEIENEEEFFSDEEEDSDNYSCVITDDEDDEDDEDYDKSLQLPRETMKRIVREIAEKVVGKRMRISADAFEILRESATGQLTEVFRICNRLVTHADRNTIMSQDFEVLFNLIRDLYGPQHPLLKRNDEPNDITGHTRTTLNSTIKRRITTTTTDLNTEKMREPRETTSQKPKKAKKTKIDTLSKLKKITKKSTSSSTKKSVNIRKSGEPTIEMEVESEKHESKKRKLEQLDRIEEENKRAAKRLEEAEEVERARKREKREEIKRKSKLVQQESQALIQRITSDPNNDNFHYGFEMPQQV